MSAHHHGIYHYRLSLFFCNLSLLASHGLLHKSQVYVGLLLGQNQTYVFVKIASNHFRN